MRRLFWPLGLVALATAAVAGVFTTSRLFFVRDLAAYFWPHHLWLRRVLGAGELPLWSPEPALGYPAHADPALQLFFWPTLPLRLLLPAVVGFNVSVALPYPVAALGMWTFLRRRSSPAASAVGALAFALSGPVLSLASCTNLAWCAALLPWILWCVDAVASQGGARAHAALALLLATSFFAGEPLAFGGSLALAVAYAFVSPEGAAAARLRATGRAAGACATALLLAAVQLLPLIALTAGSVRGAGRLEDGYHLHPLRLLEAVAPFVLGNYLGTVTEMGPWLVPLSGGRDPYLFSLYCGIGALALAAAAMASRRRRGWALFWAAVAAVAVVLSLGGHTAAYPALRSLPGGHLFRYPAKFALFGAAGLAALAAAGFDATFPPDRREPRARRLALAVLGGTAVLAGLATLGTRMAAADAAAVLASLAGTAARGRPEDAMTWLAASLSSAAPRLAVLSLGLAALAGLGSSPRPRAGLARGGWVAVLALDLLAANGGLNPTMPARRLGEPAWLEATRAHPESRVFVAQSLASSSPDPDLPPRLVHAPHVPPVQALAVYGAVLPRFPAAWGVREVLSTDLTGLQPLAHLLALETYEASDRESRTLFLRRAGVRYHLLPRPPFPGAPARARLADFAPLALYEDAAAEPPAALVPAARLEREAAGAIRRLFDRGHDPAAVVVLDDPAAVRPGAGAPGGTAEVVRRSANGLWLRAEVPAGGAYLLVLEGYAPGWRATVDGRPAPVLRANGLFRALWLDAGAHEVALRYRPRALLAGAVVTALTAAALLALCGARRAAAPGAAA
ncbi:MAG TPA: YfhO family protein [Vicinamibacteria bacterium]